MSTTAIRYNKVCRQALAMARVAESADSILCQVYVMHMPIQST